MKQQTKAMMKVHKIGNRNFGLTAAIFAAGCLAFGAKAGTVTTTQTVDGVKWQLVINTSSHADLRTARLGIGANINTSEAARMAVLEGLPERLIVPSIFTIDGIDYPVTEVAARSFARNRTGKVYDIVFPLDIDILFKANVFISSSISNILFKGSSTVAGGAAVQTYSTLTLPALAGDAPDYTQSIVSSCAGVNAIVVGPNVKVDDKGKLANLFPAATGAVLLVPRNVGNMSWDGSDQIALGGTGNTVAYYGPAEAFDIEMHDTYVTFIPNTANGLSDALGWAQTFKTAFDIDSRINITNRLEMTAAVTEAMLQNVTLAAPPWYITFAVQTQTQLDNALAAVQADVPVIIDIDGATENIVVPDNREVAILAKGGWTFRKKLTSTGIVISFK